MPSGLSLCGTAGWQAHRGALLGCRPESGGLPDVDKAWYRLLSAHSVCPPVERIN